MKVAIFGGGIAGLTAAHELSEAGADVTVYEMSNELGGFAKSSWSGDLPTEHSWRGYAPFYNNTFELMKRIPKHGGRGTVYDNLSLPVTFLHLRDKATGRKEFGPKATWKDGAMTNYRMGRAMTSDKRPYTNVGAVDALRPGLSRDGAEIWIKTIGPWSGQDAETMSLHHFAWFYQLTGIRRRAYTHTHIRDGIEYKNGTGPRAEWHVMAKPTNEAWFNPWAAHLRARGVKFVFGAELTRIDSIKGATMGCYIMHDGDAKRVLADKYIVAVDPYTCTEIATRSELRSTSFDQLRALTETPTGEPQPPHVQIAFQMEMRDGAGLQMNPTEAFILSDSEFNITVCPQEHFFDQRVLQGRRIWSGTACSTSRAGKLFGLPASELTRAQFREEVISQLVRSKELGIKKSDILRFVIWKDWSFPPAVSAYPKWVNRVGTYKHRPSQKTDIEHLILTGAHTKTTMDIWSMEGAVESGKLAARIALGGEIPSTQAAQVPLYYHKPLPVLAAMSKVDNVLYAVGLPNVLDCLVAVIILILLILVVSLIRRGWKKRAEHNADSPGALPQTIHI